MMVRYLRKPFFGRRQHIHKCLRSVSLRDHSSVAHETKYTELLSLMNRQFKELDVQSFRQIIDNSTDAKIRNKIEIILNEYEYEKQSSFRVPSTLTVEQMKELLGMSNTLDRKMHMSFLCRVENMKKSQRARREANRKPKLESRPSGIWGPNRELVYGLHQNSMVQRISESAVNRLHRHRLRLAALFGPKLVIDLDFDRYMKLHENRLLLKQLSFLYNYNKYEARHPFDLHFVNCNAEELTIKEMYRWIPKVNDNDFFVTMHYKKSYLDVFPKEKLVYLSPHSEEVLSSVSEDDIYIIGGIIDKSYREPITAIKAREDGIRSARLPITEHMKWIKGSQNLCINQVLGILHDWKENNDWKKTLKTHIPSRKLLTKEELLILSLKQEKWISLSKYI